MLTLVDLGSIGRVRESCVRAQGVTVLIIGPDRWLGGKMRVAFGSQRRKGGQRAVGKARVPEHLIIRVVLLGRRIAAALPGMERYLLVALVEA